jgi:hypothetical protein
VIPAKLHRLVRVRALIEVALPHLHTLPPAQRADVYEGISDVTRGIDETLCATAATIATHLREAELLQLNFRSLLADPEIPTQSE